MITKFSQSFQHRSKSHASLYPSTPTPTSPTSTQSMSHSPPRRERAILPPGVEGKLLVPDVKLKVHSCSSMSLPSTWSGPTSASSTCSPLSLTSDSEEEVRSIASASLLPGYRKRPIIESELPLIFLACNINTSTAHSWSYDNFKTYHIMQLPPKKVKQIQRRIINSEERVIKVEVDNIQPWKQLFIFVPSLLQVPQWSLDPLSVAFLITSHVIFIWQFSLRNHLGT